ncbi:P-loop containing nucleoside triphosphate hydrolase protein [Yarrowia lipolytica]|jgi:ribosome assembly protein 1|uniref:Ribosome assembly protein 1 n=2 Tax=Yarrowia lipolytica TaxID=4952 RepID=Q6C8W8_YARLI|nr:YALI0D16291p [Yarrowia lipolytica CLIB122]AOW04139.1 hypothetical protein YALI1_D20118g [Yarrowia lipolytica]KAB8281967.1 P-loop containing nucleoside triphosphate hydrolase protein [Yarrowia lipolytica]KAE8170660.1 P-loop containing nucleoside triphosphate hydrolase protein [Yarrowia lipolytica]KAJ8054324.1 P-loop containing nucleoside triphosphate hydrolase protein [Yarrowia lipolytica]QNP98361.1 Ribosome assembly protein 1 [Yarrowia lipolytica]|eukprot:XP_502894.1 YALI0D16291p [Yarrowia lipolytica CLIB122]
MTLSPLQLRKLQSDPSSIRNICILAHVDHGKTSLSDCLLASNGIISQKMAGKLRYLDSRPDEQERGITMESSAISLHFRTFRRDPSSTEEPPKMVPKDFLINLVDSPGHIDFSSEVSTASRLCDGAVVLVDAVEGVCSQTVTVLRQAWMEQLKPILVINKIDRLVEELQLTPAEAFTHLKKLIEGVNVVLGGFYASNRMAADLEWRESGKTGTFEDEDDSELYFSPEKNNVIFASAIDGWGFTVAQFVAIYAAKLGMKRENLQKCLWGDFYFDPKTKSVITSKGLKGRNLKPLFVQLVLDNIWAVYHCTVIERDADKSARIIKALELKISPRDLNSKDARNLLTTIFQQWVPLSVSVLHSVVDKLPDPIVAQGKRMPAILKSVGYPDQEGNGENEETVSQGMLTCSTKAPLVAYISKVVSIPEADLPKNQKVMKSIDQLREQSRLAREKIENGQTDESSAAAEAAPKDEVDDLTAAYSSYDYEEDFDIGESNYVPPPPEVLIGFVRVYSGVIRTGQKATVLGPKYNPAEPSKHVLEVEITDLYLLMGRELVTIDHAPAGGIVGIGGLDGEFLKSGTLVSDQFRGPNLAAVEGSMTTPIVRVALEPEDPTQMSHLEEGLKLLNQSDPCVQVHLQDTGEHVISCAGELHLERCLKDLTERFAGIEIQASEPIVPYRESIVAHQVAPGGEPAPMRDAELGRGVVTLELEEEGHVDLKMHVTPLPQAVVTFLIFNRVSVAALAGVKSAEEETEDSSVNQNILNKEDFQTKLAEILEEEKCTFTVDQIVAFGPKRVGSNILIDNSESGLLRRFFGATSDISFHQDSILTGFQLATQSGPLCNEPMQGVAVYLDLIDDPNDELAGKLISPFQKAIYTAFLDWSPRLMLATYSCEIQASTEVLGKVYSVVTRRKGKIVSEEMKEGTPFFTISATIPVVEAFGFAEEIRKRTSGAAQPQLIFAGYETFDMDPFWVPTTEEELEELGETADRENVARRYVDNVRARKGLYVEKKLVDGANRQRNLKK